nr:MAG TPA: hypothetical protein [Caudoviricetes sp.]
MRSPNMTGARLILYFSLLHLYVRQFEIKVNFVMPRVRMRSAYIVNYIERIIGDVHIILFVCTLPDFRRYNKFIVIIISFDIDIALYKHYHLVSSGVVNLTRRSHSKYSACLDML